MRYQDWDVILFPRDSLVPIQEFRTAHYASQDKQGHQLSTLTCYISSLPTSTPFRISIHSWATPPKPSALIESRRKTNQRVVYTAQVIVDGARVFHSVYEIGTKWPQEIINEKRSVAALYVQSSKQNTFLEFPPFHQNILWQSSWDAREHSGRIKVLLSEQLVRKSDIPGEVDFETANNIVCFVFQHAPRDILEQAGISWPIRNPLYRPSTLGGVGGGPPSPQTHDLYTKDRDFATEARALSPLSNPPRPIFTRPRNPEPYARPRTDPPQFSPFLKPLRRNHKLPKPCTDTFDEMSLDSWSTKQASSADVSMPDMFHTASLLGHHDYPWRAINPQHNHDQGQNSVGNQPKPEKSTRQVMVTLRDDQFGQLIEAISPPKQPSHLPPLPRMAGMSIPTRRSAASLTRQTSYRDPSMKSKLSCAPETTRPPTAYPHANRVPTPHPFVTQPQTTWDSDISMRDTSSIFSNLPHQPLSEHTATTAPIPSADGNVKSKKEGMFPPSGLPSSHDTRHDQSLLPEIDDEKQFLPGHKGMSSIDSTGRLERQLFSALGEELNSFNENVDPTVGATELEGLETPATKRKRQGTFGADRGRSPAPKMIREDSEDVVEISHLRGGE